MKADLSEIALTHLIRTFAIVSIATGLIAGLSVRGWACDLEAVANESARGEPPINVLLICVDDLRPELGCYGSGHIDSPHIDALAARSRLYTRHYVQAPTCGASRFAMLTGCYGPGGNDALFKRAGWIDGGQRDIPPSMPAWFRQHGYHTVSIGKVSHHPGGRGGTRWNDPSDLEMPHSWDVIEAPSGAWNDPRGWMHGLAHGEIRTDTRTKNGTVEMDATQAAEGGDAIYPDGITIPSAVDHIERLGRSRQPFFMAVGILRPHLPFGAPAKYLRRYDGVHFPPITHPDRPSGKTTWHRSGEFFRYDRDGRDPRNDDAYADHVRRHYAACVSYADANVGRLIEALDRSGVADDTVVVLWGDHGWHLGEHAVWGKHTLFEESLRSPLIIRTPDTIKRPARIDTIVESIDLFPTLCSMTNLPLPERVDGHVLPERDASDERDDYAIAYHRNAHTIRTRQHRLVQHSDGAIELYDHTASKRETKNIAAEQSEISDRLIEKMRGVLDQRLLN